MKQKVNRIIRKYFEYVLTKLKVLLNEKHFRYENVNLKYMYKNKKNTDMLVIVFSACTRPGLRARYNYVKTLEGMPCNRLYILDDFCTDRRGSFYLGRMPEFDEEKATLALITKVIADIKPKLTIFCGSCKGGYGALNFGCRFKDAVLIIGEPTYRIASEFKLSEHLMHYWMDEVTDEKIRLMDSYLAKQLKKYKGFARRIHYFYSYQDEYYEKHTKPLLEDLYKFGYEVCEEKSEFEKHADLSLYFPDFLKKRIGEYIQQWNN